MKNLLVSFQSRVKRLRHRPCFRFFENNHWHTLSWLEVQGRVCDLALGLKALGVKTGDRVAILSATRYEWTLCDLAVLSLGAVTVPIYPSSTPEQIAYILENSGSKAAIFEDPRQLKKLEASRRRLKSLHSIVLIQGKGKGVIGLEELRQLGQGGDEGAWEEGIRAILPTQMATIVYTSGTTGPPKGVILTHENFLKEVIALEDRLDLDRRHTALLFLPLAHIFARAIQFWQLHAGFIQAYGRSVDEVPQDLIAVRPHFFASVPRIFEKFYEKILAAVQTAPKTRKWILKLAPFLLSRKIRRLFGGRLRCAVSGGAPLSPELARFFWAHKVKVLEGYGLTETTAAVFINDAKGFRFGSVGRPALGVKGRIAKDGEVLIKAPMVFRGYYKNLAATRRAFTRDGWFKTGDIGEIDPAGFLKITDRKKDLIVTAAGKNIAPQNIENLLRTVPYISQTMVHGDRRKYLTALVTLNREAVAGWMTGRGVRLNGHTNLGRHPDVQRLIRNAIEEKNGELASFETIKRFAILDNDFTQEGGELTPTLKLKRKMVVEKYRDVLEGLYS